jgi:predicted membrane-bound spermidine synthase
MGWFFAFFILSGFCGLVYQVVWLRIAMATFGVTTPLVSIVLSVFMAGLAAGSWGAGRLAGRLESLGPGGFLQLYAGAELLIGVSGIAVAPLLGWGRVVLGASGGETAWGSLSYYLASAAWITGALFPFCFCMGATFPLAMAGIRAVFPDASPRSFSFLYVANVLGAITGALGSAFVLVEILGFRKTLLVATAVNATVATMALIASNRLAAAPLPVPALRSRDRSPSWAETVPRQTGKLGLAFLFTTGLVSLALEVVWTRQYAPFQGPMVYAFATILAVYLYATVIGSRIYRARSSARGAEDMEFPWVLAGVLAGTSGLLTLLAADPRIPLPYGLLTGMVRVVIGIAPFCAVLGFFTPMLVDLVSAGNPDRAGTAYAVNTLGCIVGPLLSGFVLLPFLGERWTTVLLILPLFALGAAGHRANAEKSPTRTGAAWPVYAAIVAAVLLIVLTRDFETMYTKRIVRRDHTATVIATGEGRQRMLLVNGVGTTLLTPITKMMSHLPLALLDRPPQKGLVLCLGMGTSYRSMLTWGIPTTVVELVPSIPSLLSYYHADGEAVRNNARGRIVVDDARRFLERSAETFDVIVVDPPPPPEAAGSSLLYSTEFYNTLRRRLAPDGILQQWLAWGDKIVISAVAKALAERFPYVRVFTSVEGWGFHFLASGRPIPNRTAAELAQRLPAAATKDLIEWGPALSPEHQFLSVVGRELPFSLVIGLYKDAPVLTDDRPVNEYYFLRWLLSPPNALSTNRYDLLLPAREPPDGAPD